MNSNNPILYLLRGLPGAGKSTFAETMEESGMIYAFFEADQYFIDAEGQYIFDPTKLHMAHKQCQLRVKQFLNAGYNVAVANTLTTDKEINQYMEIAAAAGAKVVSLIVENRHGNSNVHDVPTEAIERMRNRFVISL